MAIQKTYGSPSAGARHEPILSLGAGYHRFFARPGAPVLQNYIRTGATVNPLQGKYVPLFKSSKKDLGFKKSGPSKTVQYGDYRGNYILYKYVAENDLKQLPRAMDSEQYPSATSTEGSEIIGRALVGISNIMNNLGDTITTTKGLRSAEEQSAAIGLKGQVKSGKGGANPVDVDVKGRGYQVTYQKEYEKLLGHSIHGKLGIKLRSNISKIRESAKNTRKGKHKMYKNISKAGLSYFQKRLPMWNQIMKQIQGNQMLSGRALRGDIKDAMLEGKFNPNQNIYGIAMRGFRGNLYDSTGFFGKAASQMTLQALGTAAKYKEGVFNTTLIDNGVHSLVGLFMLTADPIWRYKEEEMKYAHVAYGLDATTPIIASKYVTLDSLGINRMRSHAQQLVDARVTKDTGRVGEMMTTTAAQHLTAGARLLPSMNIKAAGVELSSWVSNSLLPRLRDAASGAARNLDGEDILGSGFTEKMYGDRYTFTALPYLSVFDSVLSRYGSQ